jgi:hypothetical protein
VAEVLIPWDGSFLKRVVRASSHNPNPQAVAGPHRHVTDASADLVGHLLNAGDHGVMGFVPGREPADYRLGATVMIECVDVPLRSQLREMHVAGGVRVGGTTQ